MLQFQCPSDKAIKEPKIIPLMDKGKVRSRAAAIHFFIIYKDTYFLSPNRVSNPVRAEFYSKFTLRMALMEIAMIITVKMVIVPPNSMAGTNPIILAATPLSKAPNSLELLTRSEERRVGKECRTRSRC